MAYNEIETINKVLGKIECTPVERCWAIRNYIATHTEYDKADKIGETFCRLVMQYMPNDTMKNKHDDDCTEYWAKVIDALIDHR